MVSEGPFGPPLGASGRAIGNAGLEMAMFAMWASGRAIGKPWLRKGSAEMISKLSFGLHLGVRTGSWESWPRSGRVEIIVK